VIEVVVGRERTRSKVEEGGFKYLFSGHEKVRRARRARRAKSWKESGGVSAKVGLRAIKFFYVGQREKRQFNGYPRGTFANCNVTPNHQF
jgi:hypothetical protein